MDENSVERYTRLRSLFDTMDRLCEAREDYSDRERFFSYKTPSFSEYQLGDLTVQRIFNGETRISFGERELEEGKRKHWEPAGVSLVRDSSGIRFDINGQTIVTTSFGGVTFDPLNVGAEGVQCGGNVELEDALTSLMDITADDGRREALIRGLELLATTRAIAQDEIHIISGGNPEFIEVPGFEKKKREFDPSIPTLEFDTEYDRYKAMCETIYKKILDASDSKHDIFGQTPFSSNRYGETSGHLGKFYITTKPREDGNESITVKFGGWDSQKGVPYGGPSLTFDGDLTGPIYFSPADSVSLAYMPDGEVTTYNDTGEHSSSILPPDLFVHGEWLGHISISEISDIGTTSTASILEHAEEGATLKTQMQYKKALKFLNALTETFEHNPVIVKENMIDIEAQHKAETIEAITTEMERISDLEAALADITQENDKLEI